MSPTSLISFRSANIPETTTVSKGPEKDTFITSPLCSPIDVLRDVRAYERERQRVMKAAELVKAKERKERGTVAGRNTWGPWGDKPKTAVVRSGKTSWFAAKGLWDSDNEKGEKEFEGPGTPTRRMSKEDCLGGEVKLADLVTPSKRKNKGGFDLIYVLINTQLSWTFQKVTSKLYRCHDRSLFWTSSPSMIWTSMSPGSM
jgi:hypothetical protein